MLEALLHIWSSCRLPRRIFFCNNLDNPSTKKGKDTARGIDYDTGVTHSIIHCTHVLWKPIRLRTPFRKFQSTRSQALMRSKVISSKLPASIVSVFNWHVGTQKQLAHYPWSSSPGWRHFVLVQLYLATTFLICWPDISTSLCKLHYTMILAGNPWVTLAHLFFLWN
jgi:hypothetical protein